jgi:peroxiredoxin
MTRQKSKMILLAIFGGALFLIVLASVFWHSPPGKPRKIQCVGDDRTILPLVLPNTKGEKIDISHFRGKVVLLNFWATWCGPCRQEIPGLNELYRQFKESGLAVVGISLDRGDPEDVRHLLEKYGIEYINLLGNQDVLEAFSRIPELGGIQGIPATFLIDRKGQICRRFIGFTEKEILEEAVKSLL